MSRHIRRLEIGHTKDSGSYAFVELRIFDEWGGYVPQRLLLPKNRTYELVIEDNGDAVKERT